MSVEQAAPQQIVDPEWIAEHLGDDSVRLVEVDVAPSAYRAGHIPNAQLWNIYADLRRPGYAPIDTAELERLLSRTGVTPETTVVFYGYGAHLGLWLLRSHGHRDARLLDGPRDQWLEIAGTWSTDTTTPVPTSYPLTAPDPSVHVSREAVLAMIGGPGSVLLDTRSRAEYDGERFWPSGAPEDAGRAGRIPGSRHLPIDELRTDDGRFRSPKEIRKALRDRGIDPAQRLVTYCTIGNRASQAWYALTHILACPDAAVYQGGWAEWGSLPDTPVERVTESAAAG